MADRPDSRAFKRREERVFMYKHFSVFRSILAAVLLVGGIALVSSCGEDGVIGLGVLAPDESGASIAGNLESHCLSYCDGNQGNTELRVAYDYDLVAATELTWWDIWTLWYDEIYGEEAVQDAVDAIPDGEERVLTFAYSTLINCNSTGTTGEDLGDATGGTIRQSDVFTANFESGNTEPPDLSGDGYAYHSTLTLTNCVIEADILPEPVGIVDPLEAIRLNGTVTFIQFDPGTESATEPYVETATGRITIDADLNNDGTFGDDLWGGEVNFDVEYTNDGDVVMNGGMCFGTTVALGNADGSADDDCADNADAEGFTAASWLYAP